MANTLEVARWGRFLVVLVFALLLDTVAVKSLLSCENPKASGIPLLPWLPLPDHFPEWFFIIDYYEILLLHCMQILYHCATWEAHSGFV